MRWENKFHEEDLPLARDVNTSKLKVWNNLYYGELPYVIRGYYGGRCFQWLKISPTPNDEVKSEVISQKYDLSMVGEIMLFFYSMVQIYQLLQVLQYLLPENIHVFLYERIKTKNEVEIYLDLEFAVKSLSKMDDAKADSVRAMYKSISGSMYLIQLDGHRVRQVGKTSKLILHRVGSPSIKPINLEELHDAPHDILCGLCECFLSTLFGKGKNNNLEELHDAPHDMLSRLCECFLPTFFGKGKQKCSQRVLGLVIKFICQLSKQQDS